MHYFMRYNPRGGIDFGFWDGEETVRFHWDNVYVFRKRYYQPKKPKQSGKYGYKQIELRRFLDLLEKAREHGIWWQM